MPNLILRCTAKLLRELDPAVIQPDPGVLDFRATWCLNLLWIERRKCLLTTHQQTLFTVFVPDVRRSDLRQLPMLFLTAAGSALAAEGIPAEVPPSPDSCVIARSDIRFRRTLGLMNELAFQCRWMIEGRGGLARCDLGEIRYRLNHTLLQVKGEGYDQAIDRVRRFGLRWPSGGIAPTHE